MASAGEVARGGGTEAEIGPELPSIVVNSNKEIFLHDLISNSSHALDKIMIKLGKFVQPEVKLFVGIVLNKAAKTLTIVDNGTGMTRSDLYRHAGAVARSGFMKAPPPPNAEASVLGLGLLSAYVVADKVIITTKHDDDNQYKYVWGPQAGAVAVAVTLDDAAGDRLDRGTKITLFLKDNVLEYLAERRLKDLVNEYSGRITYPIYLSTEEEEDLSAAMGRWFSASQETLPPWNAWATGHGSFIPMFKLLTVGRCYNCLGPDHFVANCIFPTRCLLCRRSGHVARYCALHHDEYHGPGAPHRRLAWAGACAPFSDAMKAALVSVRIVPEAAAGVAAPALLYKVRVCVEGVPAHARHLETVAGLFAGGSTLVESLDDGGVVADKEAACVRAWMWTRDPDTVARTGTLLIQEPRGPTWPSRVHSDLQLTSCPTSAAGPPRMQAYEVIIHLDRVYDYSPAPGTGSSSTVGGGGLPWPRCHVFSWRLGVLDGAAPPPPPC
ncbi:unnamed protein product [Urochloa humidicola]